MNDLRNLIESYIYAKDGNRSHIMKEAFSTDAVLTMRVMSSNISFPEKVIGAAEIADTLATQFSTKFENIYTFCIGEPPSKLVDSFGCRWFVCMTDKETRSTRIGHGNYEWALDSSARKVKALLIHIEQMEIVSEEWREPILRCAQKLPYPWCPALSILAAAQAIAPLHAVCAALS
ncbi:hypothetical protein EHZ19_15950 [Paraburkholderia bannensis]|nr:hypothetical protein [Paraburkholderia bannensis]RQM47145.1 hypothetical protein EHZ19_15950 [Paraburkholderia bannensis]